MGCWIPSKIVQMNEVHFSGYSWSNFGSFRFILAAIEHGSNTDVLGCSFSSIFVLLAKGSQPLGCNQRSQCKENPVSLLHNES